MNKNFIKTFLFFICAISLATVMGCKPGARSNTTKPNAESSSDPTTPDQTTATTPQKPQHLQSSTQDYDDLSEEEKEQYEPPPKEIKFKDTVFKKADHNAKFMDVVYTGNKKSITITGRLQLIDYEDISNDDIFAFELKGEVGTDRIVLIKAYDVDKRKKNRIRVGARVRCLDLDEEGRPDCSEGIVDFAIQVKETLLYKQFSSPPVAKAAPVAPPAPVEPPKEEPPADPDAPVSPPPKDAEPNQQAEGSDGAKNGDFVAADNEDEDLVEILAEVKPTPLKPDEPLPPPKPPKKDVVLVTKDGIPRPKDQAVRLPDAGSLLLATDLTLQQSQLKEEEFYFVAHPARKKHFATFEMGLLISKLGHFSQKKFSKRLPVGNLSLVKGGHSPPHASHQNGTDGDFGYPADEEDVWFPTVVQGVGEKRKFFPNEYSADKTLALLEYAFKQKDVVVDRIFMDQYIINDLCSKAKSKGYFDPSSTDPKWEEKNEFWKSVFRTIQHVDGHGDHMHIRIKCTPPGQNICRPKIYKKVTHCQS